jgi:hypothetical protein
MDRSPTPSWLPIARSLLDAGYSLSMVVGPTAIVITRSAPPPSERMDHA